MKAFEEIARAFAGALVARDFSRARQLLAPALRAELAEHDLEERLTRMYRSYSDGEPTGSQLIPGGTLETWPGKQPGDMGWAYASIEGDDFNEGVSVLVCDVDGEPMIRKVEWGRP